MERLILVRHSQSKLDPGLPPQCWKLTQEGRLRCETLAAKLAPYQPEVILTSGEVKARETGKIIANRLKLSCREAPGLHEHRRTAGSLVSAEVFIQMVAALFASPDDLVFGLETANQALSRFSKAVQSIASTCSQRVIVLVTHGTVMSLFYGSITGLDAYEFWRELGLPAFYTVSWPSRVVLSTVMDI